jgi:hypothetical protein
MKTSTDIEAAIAHALQAIPQLKIMGALPPVLEPLLHLAPHPGKLVNVLNRRGAAGDGIWIGFAPAGPETAALAQADRDTMMAALLRVVDQMEHDPKLNFLALKFLRDRLLPDTGIGCFSTPDLCRVAIEEAIHAGLLRTTRIPNPKNPQFPVTAVALNREHAEVQRLLGAPPPPPEPPLDSPP